MILLHWGSFWLWNHQLLLMFITETPTATRSVTSRFGAEAIYLPIREQDMKAGQVETKFKAQFGVWIVRDQWEGEPQVFALKPVCTHLGCTPNWLEGEQKFKCPCHGSGFYITGINFEGPAPRPLERVGISLGADGMLEVDKSVKFREELGQWNDTTSFVEV